LTAGHASEVIARGIHSVISDAELILCPLADGGEGTAELLRPHLDDDHCLIESAELIGLNLPEMLSLPVEKRGSSAIGDAILKALDEGKRDIIVALGGSATNDAGLGMLMKLGLRAVDQNGMEVEPSLSGLLTLNRIDISNLDRRLSECSFTILTDVASPLCGKNGATAVYGPQKGVDESEVAGIDHAVSGFADICSGAFGFDPRLKEGAGAAGGLGYALMLIGGEAVSGAAFVLDMTGFRERLKDSDWVVTGEGCSDLQTLNGKLPVVVADEAKSAGVPTALLSGSVETNARDQLSKQFDLILSAQPDDLSSENAMLRAEALLTEVAAAFAKRVKHDHSVP
ncbi:MAG: glycerate kinase, partial [Mariprofundaceae bacterium]|nr:glycerate kinase [Mariprofundaceae bacterium]